MRRSDKCPTCGSPVFVVTGDEGTSHYEPNWPYESERKLAAEIVSVRQQLEGAVEAIDALLVSLDALNIEAEEGDMAEYDEAREAVERWLTINRGQ